MRRPAVRMQMVSRAEAALALSSTFCPIGLTSAAADQVQFEYGEHTMR